jgi:hypothetical protein
MSTKQVAILALVVFTAAFSQFGCSSEEQSPDLSGRIAGPLVGGAAMDSVVVTYGGRAIAARAVTADSTMMIFADTGDLPASGGMLTASEDSAVVADLLTVHDLTASTTGENGEVNSDAAAGALSVTVGGQSITATSVSAHAHAACDTDGVVTTDGDVEIVGLELDGVPVDVTGELGQMVMLTGGTMTLNSQQILGGEGEDDHDTSGLAVVAISLVMDDGVRVDLADARAEASCRFVGACHDSVSGGGWTTGTPSGAKGTFGFSASEGDGTPWCSLSYIDHAAEPMRVLGRGATGYEVVDETTRRITGNAEVNGEGGYTYQLEVSDMGEPGRGDTFSLTLSSGYSASGTLEGGNIQLHACPEE